MKTIGIDIGTTTISAVVLEDTTREVLCARTIQNGSFIETGREWERIQDPAVILEKAKAALDELLECCPDVTSIGLTGQMHGILYLDQAGSAVSPLYTWQDGRGNLPEFDGKSLTEEILETCGVHISAGYGLATHLYNLRKGLVPSEAVALCTIGDYLGMVLTGRTKPRMHISNAASLGFFDSRQSCFQREFLQKIGIDTAILPEVCEDFAELGTYRGATVCAALGDNQASFLGSVGIRENVLLLNMGTGGQMSVLSDQFFEAPGIEARPFVKGKYLLVGASLCGGRAYAILEKFFRSYVLAAGGTAEAQYDVMQRLAEKGAEQEAGMRVETTFHGTRINSEQRGSISNISEDNFTPEGLVFGVLEGMIRELYQMYELVRKGTGIRVEHLIASGNGLRKNAVLQQICRKRFDAELSLAPYEEEAACGAAISSMREPQSQYVL